VFGRYNNTWNTILAALDGVIQSDKTIYPNNLENSGWLSYYSQVFDFVEIDSSFYRMPNAFMVKNWSKKTPSHFRFTAKFPKVMTYDKRLKDIEKKRELFSSRFQDLAYGFCK
jgi:uncharacterized protein YecE (DUF72 family)